MSIQLMPFIIASLAGRAFRFFIVAAIFHYFGKSLANKLKKYFEYIGILITIIIIYIIYIKYF
jgi:membrane protein DedA with SNARE-associated domain